jgi:two-component system, chemotaxis family, CheB/CheR fusion protein
LERFLRAVPPGSDFAVVVVQHLDPAHKCILAELLQKSTPLPVTEIKDRTRLRPGRVYVIPPDRDLSLLHGTLHLLKPVATRGLRLPVDGFFRSLADDLGPWSVGVVLSGMGTDGTLGLRAIKEKCGAAFVQKPESARFDGMPRSAIDAGLADVVAEPEELPARIAAWLAERRRRPVDREREPGAAEAGGLDKVVVALRSRTGADFSNYKRSTLLRRIERRMALHQLARIGDYVHHLRENPQEADLLFKELLIGVTDFFRDPAVWERVRQEVFPALFAARPEGGQLRAWVPGCSTGEEAYTLAMVFTEALERAAPPVAFSLQVFATDIDKGAIDRARAGVFPVGIAAAVGLERLKRFFVEDPRGYCVTKKLREMVVFAPQNLVMDPPFTKLDLVSCRNLLIYFEPVLQRKALAIFRYGLKPGGFLVLGEAETVGQPPGCFLALPNKARIYRRQAEVAAGGFPEIPGHFAPARPGTLISPPMVPHPAINLQALTNSLLLQRCSPAAVLTTAAGDIVYVNGKTGSFLEPAAGKANLNLLAMARPGLREVLDVAFAKVVRRKTVASLKEVRISAPGGDLLADVTVEWLAQPATLREMVLTIFEERPAPLPAKAPGKARRGGARDARVDALTLELERARRELQHARTEMQASKEELVSANEELQSTNEELQSTNEELTTSKEEMQSMNEELQTMNQELQGKLEELSRSRDDMKNLLNSTDIATLFLDAKLHVRRFTTPAAGIISLIPGDAGRPITDLTSGLDYPQMPGDAREVMQTLMPREREVAARDGRWFAVRTKPYRTQDDRIEGVVITFLDITVAKQLEFTLREAIAELQTRIDRQGGARGTADAVVRKAESILSVRPLQLSPGKPGQRPRPAP